MEPPETNSPPLPWGYPARPHIQSISFFSIRFAAGAFTWQLAWGLKALVITSPIQERREAVEGMQAKLRGCWGNRMSRYTSSSISPYTSSKGRPWAGIASPCR